MIYFIKNYNIVKIKYKQDVDIIYTSDKVFVCVKNSIKTHNDSTQYTLAPKIVKERD